MITTLLVLAAVIVAGIGIAHSVLGEKYIVGWLLRHDLPKLFGDTSFAAGTIRMAWHLTTLFMLTTAAVLALVAFAAPAAVLLLVIGVALVLSGLFPFVFTRGRHLVWIAFLAAGALCLWAAFAS